MVRRQIARIITENSEAEPDVLENSMLSNAAPSQLINLIQSSLPMCGVLSVQTFWKTSDACHVIAQPISRPRKVEAQLAAHESAAVRLLIVIMFIVCLLYVYCMFIVCLLYDGSV